MAQSTRSYPPLRLTPEEIAERTRGMSPELRAAHLNIVRMPDHGFQGSSEGQVAAYLNQLRELTKARNPAGPRRTALIERVSAAEDAYYQGDIRTASAKADGLLHELHMQEQREGWMPAA